LSSQEYNHIVRIVGNDIPGERKLIIGLTQIKGIGYNFATAILDNLKINPNSNVGYLSDSEVQAIEKLITDPSSANFPTWFLNRRKDVETGNDLHLLTSDIDFTLRNDIERERVTSSWRGYRHLYGLKVRGQRTRCTGRKGGAVGVAKGGKAAPVKTAAPKAVAAPTGEAAAPAPAAEILNIQDVFGGSQRDLLIMI
jgi:small subunit ribosomal protein S13